MPLCGTISFPVNRPAVTEDVDMKIVLSGDTTLARPPTAHPDAPALIGDVAITDLEAPLADSDHRPRRR
jgi:hypothetical protein